MARSLQVFVQWMDSLPAWIGCFSDSLLMQLYSQRNDAEVLIDDAFYQQRRIRAAADEDDQLAMLTSLGD